MASTRVLAVCLLASGMLACGGNGEPPPDGGAFFEPGSDGGGTQAPRNALRVSAAQVQVRAGQSASVDVFLDDVTNSVFLLETQPPGGPEGVRWRLEEWQFTQSGKTRLVVTVDKALPAEGSVDVEIVAISLKERLRATVAVAYTKAPVPPTNSRNLALKSSHPVDPVGAVSDAEGNLFVAGNFEGSMNIGERALLSAGGVDGFVLKLDRDNNLVWLHQLAGPDLDTIAAIALISPGRIALAGRYSKGGATLADAALGGSASGAAFLASLDETGKPAVARIVGAAQPARLAVDPAGQLVLALSVSGAVQAEGHALADGGFGSVAVVRWNPSGRQVASRVLAFNDRTTLGMASDVGLDSQGRVYLAGSVVGFGGSLAGSAFSVNGAQHGHFVARLDTTLKLDRLTAFGAPAPQLASGRRPEPLRLAVASGDALYVGASFNGTATFGSHSLPSTQQSSGYLARLEADDTWRWAVRVEAKEVLVSDVEASPTGVWLMGRFTGTLATPVGQRAERGYGDGFAVSLTAMGGGATQVVLGSTQGAETLCATATRLQQERVFVGSFGHELALKEQTLRAHGPRDGFVVSDRSL